MNNTNSCELTLLIQIDAKAFNAKRLKTLYENDLGGQIGSCSRMGNFFQMKYLCNNQQNLLMKAESGELTDISKKAGAIKVIELWINNSCCYESLPLFALSDSKIKDVSEKEINEHLAISDILLVTATQIELKTLISFLKPIKGHDSILRGPIQNKTFRVGCFGRYYAAHIHCAMGGQDRHGSTLAVKEAVDIINPRAVFVLGIAFGADKKKQRLGDVLIAETISPYEPQKLNDNFAINRGRDMLCGHILFDRFSNFHDDWEILRESGNKVKVHYGLVLSGEKVIANEKFKNRLLKEYPTAIGGEMEGAGAYAAVQSKKIEIILVKGICDWADGSKNDRAQPFAAYTAISLAEHVLNKPDVLLALAACDQNKSNYCTACTVEPVDVSLEEPDKLRRASAWNKLIDFITGNKHEDPQHTKEDYRIKFTVEIDLNIDELESIQKIFNLLKEHSQDNNLKCLKIDRGSLILHLKGAPDGYKRLLKLFNSGELGKLIGAPVLNIKKYYISSDDRINLFKQVKSLSVPDKKDIKTVVCHLDKIIGFDNEYKEAIGFLSEKITSSINECMIYITKKDNLFYCHSNFKKPGFSYPTKIATNETNDILTFLFNILCSDSLSQEERKNIIFYHENKIKYFINSKLINEDGLIDINVNGAKNIEFIGLIIPLNLSNFR